MIRVAVVGVGYWGANLIRVFGDLPGAELAVACDLDAERLARACQGRAVATSSDLDAVLSDSRIDAVAIATPAESHADVARRALTAGKHVYVEKPLATGLADARELVECAKSSGRQLFVGHIFLYDAAVLAMIDQVRAGAVGGVRYVHGVRTGMGGTARLDTSVVWDSLVHDAYILPELLGRLPVRVLVNGASYLTPGVEDVVFATFDFGQGLLAQLFVSWYAFSKVRRYDVVGERAVLGYDDLAADRLQLCERRYEPSAELDPRGRRRWLWHDGSCQAIAIERAEPLRRECQHFVESLQAGQSPRTDGMAGLRAVAVLDACERSLRAGGTWVEVTAREGALL